MQWSQVYFLWKENWNRVSRWVLPDLWESGVISKSILSRKRVIQSDVVISSLQLERCKFSWSGKAQKRYEVMLYFTNVHSQNGHENAQAETFQIFWLTKLLFELAHSAGLKVYFVFGHQTLSLFHLLILCWTEGFGIRQPPGEKKLVLDPKTSDGEYILLTEFVFRNMCGQLLERETNDLVEVAEERKVWYSQNRVQQAWVNYFVHVLTFYGPVCKVEWLSSANSVERNFTVCTSSFSWCHSWHRWLFFLLLSNKHSRRLSKKIKARISVTKKNVWQEKNSCNMPWR